MMKYRYTLLVSFLIIMSACSNSKYEEQMEYKVLSFTLETEKPSIEAQSSFSSTRKSSEEEIQSLHLLFFSTLDGRKVWASAAELSSISQGKYRSELVIDPKIYELLLHHDWQIYFVANHPDGFASIQSLDAFEKHILTQEVVQQPLLMLGSSYHEDLDFIDQRCDLGVVELERLVARLQLSITEISLPDFELVGSPEVQIKNYASKTSLLKEKSITLAPSDFKHSSWLKLQRTDGAWILEPTYILENDWSNQPYPTTYLVKLRLKKANVVHDYFYEVPIAAISDSKEGSRIERNTIYHTVLAIHELGQIDPAQALSLEGQVYLKDWSAANFDYNITSLAYLHLDETQFSMIDIATYDVPYRSSTDITDVSIDKTYGYRYNASGGRYVDQYDKSAIEVSIYKDILRINSPIPRNFTPKYIEITVRNQDNLSKKIEITQYPDKYIELAPRGAGGVYRNHLNNAAPGQHPLATNFNLYKVITKKNSFQEFFNNLVGMDNFVNFFIGDPTNGTSYTLEDAASNRLISPEFIISSHNNLALDMPYTYAKDRCYNYFEGGYGPNGNIKKGRWRLPTLAEAVYIEYIQKHRKSPVSNLLPHNTYWVANRTQPKYYKRVYENGTMILKWFDPDRNPGETIGGAEFERWDYRVLYHRFRNREDVTPVKNKKDNIIHLVGGKQYDNVPSKQRAINFVKQQEGLGSEPGTFTVRAIKVAKNKNGKIKRLPKSILMIHSYCVFDTYK